MSQNYTEFPNTEALSISYSKIINNFKANRSLNSGTSYPATNLEEGVPCWRTDLDTLFIYDGVSAWNKINAANADTLGTLAQSDFLRSNTGDTYSGGILRYQQSGGITFEGSLGAVNGLQVYQPTSPGDSFLSFNIEGDYGVHFGLDGSTNKLSVGGWSLGANSYAIYHEGNKPTAVDLNVLDSAQNLSDVVSTTTAFNNIKQAATETSTGVIEKATTAEAQAGTANKFPDSAGVHSSIAAYLLNTITQIKRVRETVYTHTGTTWAASTANGSIVIWDLTDGSVVTDSLVSGDSVTLVVIGVLDNIISWPTIKWKDGAAPTLDGSNDNIIELVKVGTTLYGAYGGVFS